MIETISWLIPLPPLLAFGLIVLFAYRSNRVSHTLGIGAMLITWALAMSVFLFAVSGGELPVSAEVEWLPTGDSSFNIGIWIDSLTAVTLFFVAWTMLAIFVYSVGYHNYGKARDPKDRPGLPPHAGGIDPMYARFFAFISLFAFGMLALVVTDNLLVLFVGWEIMGMCSYMLIGFWYGKDSAKAAMVKAFMTTRVGDVFMLLGLAYLYWLTGTLTYSEILFNPETLERLATTPSVLGPGTSAAALIALLFFIGTVGKSAQWPLHTWLPDAMEGPTPVSAMIHAATMVSAGIYLILRIFPLISAGWQPGEPLPDIMVIIAFIGAFTALFASTLAIGQNDIKRVLAYSTISQLGYMVAAVGIGAFVAAAFHLVVHAFFKGLLFLGSGSVIHGVEHGAHETGDHIDPNDMTHMGGLWKKMPLTFWTFLIGGLTLAGFPIVTAGFWSKDEILAEAFGTGHIAVFIVLALAAFITAFYIMRQITMTFLGKPRSEAAKHAHESTWTMTVPLVVLAIFSVTIGWAGIPRGFPVLSSLVPNWVQEFVDATLLEPAEALEFNSIPLLVSVSVALGGLLIGYLMYRRLEAGAPDPLARLGRVYVWIQDKFYFDELYDFLFVRPAYWFAETFVYRGIDRRVIDGFLHWVAGLAGRLGGFLRNKIDLPIINGTADLVGEGVKTASHEGRVIQTGRIQTYLVVGIIFTGALLSYIFFLL
ncbi:MAG: NADH-quinone oxidoreductase subunit L [Anaerolineae bacterium]|nr:MAG: NADH-quinone oxidoreductase subunit L [Anaerolineae bacterium]